MLLQDKLLKTPNWSKNNGLNRWCDYIELRCLCSQDKMITKDDVIIWFNGEEDEDGSENHSGIADRREHQVETMFEQINYRHSAILLFYPFEYEDGCLSIKASLDKKNLQYIVLLICSSISFLDKSSSSKMTKYFEEYCVTIFKYLVSSDAEVYLFGTSRSGELFSGNLRSRIEKLAEAIGAQTTKTFDSDPQFDVPGGDEGLDLVAFNKIDKATHIPLAFGQCTCSYLEWNIKQEEIGQDTWKQKIEPLPVYSQYMFVSFFCRNANGKFENPATITTCLIDRLRIIRLISLHAEIFDYINLEEQYELLYTCCGEVTQNIGETIIH